MAAKKGREYSEIMSQLKARNFSPVYILMGEESYYIDQISDYIENNVLREEERDFNQSVVYGIDVTGVQVADMAKRYPMMAEYQVVIVKEAQNLRQWDALEAYFEKPMMQTILVICYKNGTIDGRRKIVSKAKAVGVVFESKRLYESQLPEFVETYLEDRGVKIDRKSVQMVVEHIGSDLHRLVSELDKVIDLLPENNQTITPELIEKQIGVSKDYNGFELKDAIVAKNVFKANQIIKYFGGNPKGNSNLYGVLPILFSYFQNLMIAFYTPNNQNPSALAAALGVKGTWGVKDYIAGMRNYSAAKTLQIISKIRETDAKTKGIGSTSNTEIGDLMKELIFFILH